MKAIRLVKPGNALQEQEIAVPDVGPDDVLIRIAAAGICHSDAHYRGGISSVNPLPLTLGHEVAGIVEATGNGVGEFRQGDRVCVHYLVTWGSAHTAELATNSFAPPEK